jgi:hypothetical protein
VLGTIKMFLEKPFEAAVEGKVYTGKWSADENGWV